MNTNQKQTVNSNENFNQKGEKSMNNSTNLKKFKVYDENDDKVELHLYFIDGEERVFSDYIWVPKNAITENGLDEATVKDIVEDVEFETKRYEVQLFWIEEEREKSEDDDDEDSLTFFIIG